MILQTQKKFIYILLLLWFLMFGLIPKIKSQNLMSNPATSVIELNPCVVSITVDKFALIYQTDNVSFEANSIYNFSIKADLKSFDPALGGSSNTDYLINSLKSNVVLNGNRITNKVKPSADLLSDGNIIIAYADTTEKNIYLIKTNQDLTVLTADTIVNTELSGDVVDNPKVLALKNSTFLVIWEYKSASTSMGIYGKIYNNADLSVATKNMFLISEKLSDTAIFSDADIGYPNVSLFKNGSFVVTWHSKNQDGYNNYSVFFQIFDQDGNKIGSIINATSSSSADNDKEPFVQVLKGGNIVITWTKIRTSSFYDIFGRIFGPNGAAVGLAFIINRTSQSGHRHMNSSSVPIASGGFVVYFSRYIESGVTSTNDNSNFYYMMINFKADGTTIETELSIFSFTFYEMLLWTGLPQETYCVENIYYKVRSANFDTFQSITGTSRQCSLWSDSTYCYSGSLRSSSLNYCDIYPGPCNNPGESYFIERIGGDFLYDISYNVISNTTSCNYPKLDVVVEKRQTSGFSAGTIYHSNSNVNSYVLPALSPNNDSYYSRYYWYVFHVVNTGYKFCPTSSYSPKRICCYPYNYTKYSCCTYSETLKVFNNPYYQKLYMCYSTPKNKFSYIVNAKQLKNNFVLTAVTGFSSGKLTYNNLRQSYYEKIYFSFMDFDNVLNEIYYSEQFRPRVSALSNGNFVVAWVSYYVPTSNYQIFFKILDASKNVIKMENRASLESNNHDYVRIAPIDKKFFLFWYYNYASCYGIYGAMYDNSGNRIISPLNLLPCSSEYMYYKNEFNVFITSENKIILSISQYKSSSGYWGAYFLVLNPDFSIAQPLTSINTNNNTSSHQYNVSFTAIVKDNLTKYVVYLKNFFFDLIYSLL